MVRRTLLIFLAIACILIAGCKDEFKKKNLYAKPSWLAGKLYSQILAQPELSTFAHCIKLVGYDTIINVSGSFAVFAPNNDAFTLYLQAHSNYTSVDQIPIPELTRIVKFHIIQDPWSIDQLQQLDVYGWIDTTDINNNVPRGYKRQTLLLENNRNYGYTFNRDSFTIIVDTLQSGWIRRQATDSRKYAPIFYQQYFNVYNLSLSDFNFYFDRSFVNASDVFYVNGRIIKGDIFAENGFVHIIDRVVDPLQNAFQILSTKTNSNSYAKFLGLVDIFSSFSFNQGKTNAQAGARLGYKVDSLFDITYPQLTFAITNEITKAPAGVTGLPADVTVRYQYGLVAPTDAAIDNFVSNYLAVTGGWGNLQLAPYSLKRIIVNTQMANIPIYGTDITNGFLNGEKDVVTVDPTTIIQKQYGSNCSFIGVNKMIIPRAFKSITGPIYLLRGYSTAMYAIEKSGLLAALKRQNQNYMLFVESDSHSGAGGGDSSLIYNTNTKRFYAIQKHTQRLTNFNTNDLRTLLLNHTAVANPKGIARKEFIQNLAGNFIIVNNQTGVVKGTAPTTFGYQGDPLPDSTLAAPTSIHLSAYPDNGNTFDIANWFSFSVQDMYQMIKGLYPQFHALLKKAGFDKSAEARYTFISDNENYTVFVPNAAALAAYRADTIGGALATPADLNRLKKFCLMHFIQGSLIFTDGNQLSGYYKTLRPDERSTPFTTVYSKVYIGTGPDVINFQDKSGSDYLTVNESSRTNIITGRILSTGTAAFPNLVSNGVIHEISKVLLFNEMNTAK